MFRLLRYLATNPRYQVKHHLDGAEFYLETLVKDGRKNIDALTQVSAPQESEPAADANAESAPASQEQSATGSIWLDDQPCRRNCFKCIVWDGRQASGFIH